MKDFTAWNLSEHLGNGTETFTDKLETSSKGFLSMYGSVASWGDEIESATGEIEYEVQLEIKKSGLEGIIFSIKKIELEIEVRTYKGKDDIDGELSYHPLSIEEEQISYISENNNLNVEIGKFPFYIDSLDISLNDDKDGEIDWDNVKIDFSIGHFE